MPWYAKAYCPCCAECAFREGNACAKRPRRVMCDAHCPDRALSGGPGALLTDEECARCATIAAQPQARYRLLTHGEMARLLWFHAYFGDREHREARP